jgi:N-acetyl-gamma-glutamyl-phosphate reductase
MKVRAAVAGANGYAGMTLVHLLARHPGVELAQLTSRSFAGHRYQDVFPLLELEGSFREDPDASTVDVVFSCLPHNVGAARAAGWLAAGARVIDMSADFRLRDASEYPRWYRQAHPAPELLGRAVFGLPELHAGDIEGASLVAVPGCHSTAAILGLAPAVAAGLVGGDVVVDSKTGVSGAGRSPSVGVHFAEVSETVHAYSISGHRHSAELLQELGLLAGGTPPRVTLVTHLIPMIRGILVTCYFDLVGSIDQLRDAYAERYARQPFTRLLDQTPTTKLTRGTNLCLVNVAAQGSKAVVTAAIDNLVKGASGQGIECFNIAFGLGRTAGLEGPLQWP